MIDESIADGGITFPPGRDRDNPNSELTTMNPGPRGPTLALALTTLVSFGCQTPAAPDTADSIQITLAVSGGIAGVDWQYTVDGRQARILGDRCRGETVCDWEPGDVLATVDLEGLAALGQEFFARGFFDSRESYGTECCDQFDYRLTYVDSDDEWTVEGSDGTLPSHILSLVLLVQQFVSNARG